MDWQDRRESDQIEDQRGNQSSGGGGGIGVAGLMFIFSRLGFKGSVIVIIIGVIVWKVFGINPFALVTGQPLQQQSSVSTPYKESAPEAETHKLVGVILADTEDTWQQIFNDMNRQYQKPKLVLYSGSTHSGCGAAQAAMGPFYCPADRKVYLDMAFFQEMRRKMGIEGNPQGDGDANNNRAGDFAVAYVIAHEVGHHVQNLLGISGKVTQAMQQGDEKTANALSVKLELQADCFAGVWAYHNNQRTHFLQPGDVEEALDTAQKIGDDYLQKQARGYSVPDSFTHGSSQQREHWLKTGLDTGDINQCDTFSANNL